MRAPLLPMPLAIAQAGCQNGSLVPNTVTAIFAGKAGDSMTDDQRRNNDREQLLKDIGRLTGSFQTVLLGTCSRDGDPEISYSPCVTVGRFLYVFVSELSVHTGNLHDNPRASLLFIENESDSRNLHARRRVTFRAGASSISRDDPEWTRVLQEFEDRFGEIIAVLKSLPDFHLFRFSTDSATIVRGFADAHTVACDRFEPA